MSVAAVVWDIGNVLLEWDPHRFYDGAIGEERRRALFQAVDLLGMNERVDAGAPWAESVAALAAAHPEWADAIGHWHGRWLEMIGPPIEGSVRLLRALKGRGVPCLALTNFGRETFDLALGHFPFLREFDGAFVSGRLRVSKPDPAIYEAVERGSGLAGPALLFVDDRPENVGAAAARGWRTHLFDGPEGLAGRLAAEGLLDAAAA